MEFRDPEGESEWEDAVRRSRCKRQTNNSDSLGGTESEGREVEVGLNNLRSELFNVVVRFEGEGGVKKTDPLKLTNIIKAQVEVKYARVLGDGNLLIGCSSEKLMEKARE